MLPWEIRVTSLISDAGDLSSCYSAGSAGGTYTLCMLLAALAFYSWRLKNKDDPGHDFFCCSSFITVFIIYTKGGSLTFEYVYIFFLYSDLNCRQVVRDHDGGFSIRINVRVD